MKSYVIITRLLFCNLNKIHRNNVNCLLYYVTFDKIKTKTKYLVSVYFVKINLNRKELSINNGIKSHIKMKLGDGKSTNEERKERKRRGSCYGPIVSPSGVP